ncbi:MAG: hypothetical protein U1E76_04350 [Planctomycetota bacterium]
MRRFEVTLRSGPEGGAFPPHWRELPRDLEPWVQASLIGASRALLRRARRLARDAARSRAIGGREPAMAAAAQCALRARVSDTLVAGDQVSVDAAACSIRAGSGRR